MGMAGSILPSESPAIFVPIPFAGGVLQVERDLENETYHLTFDLGAAGTGYLAAHPNGYSCRELGERITQSSTRAWQQATYIIRCGGYVVEPRLFQMALLGFPVARSKAELLVREGATPWTEYHGEVD